jgi:hypothetical protein
MLGAVPVLVALSAFGLLGREFCSFLRTEASLRRIPSI